MHKLGYCACDLGIDEIKKAKKRAKNNDDFEKITGKLI